MIKYTTLIGIVFSGAVINGLVQVKYTRAQGLGFDLVDFVIAVIIAGFCGWLFSMAAISFLDDPNQIGVISGAGAFMGLKGVNLVIDTIISIVTQTSRPK